MGLVSALCRAAPIPEEKSSAKDISSSSEIAALTAAMRRGDEAAYHRFFELYSNRLLRYLLVMCGGNEEAAKEAVQLTLLRIVRHIKRFDSEEVFWSWLTVLARSSVVDERRKEKRYSSLLERWFAKRTLEAPAGVVDSEHNWSGNLEEILGELPAGERELIERKYIAGQSIQEIADATQRTAKAVESRLVRARKRLRMLLVAHLKHEKQF